jgi:SAM-dependent methyltransferase
VTATSTTEVSYEIEYRGLRIKATSNLHAECMRRICELGLPPGARTLDVGAGSGALSQRLIDHGFRVEAIERDRDTFLVSAPCHTCDLNTDFSTRWSEPFDLIVAIEVIEHLYDPRHFIRSCLAILRPGGTLIVTSPNVESWVSRIRFLRDGRFLWFEESDYHGVGHVTPIFSWRIAQICEELGAHLIEVGHTEDRHLRAWTGGSHLLRSLRNKTFYLGALHPFMRGRKHGELHIYVIRKPLRAEGGGSVDTLRPEIGAAQIGSPRLSHAV